MTGVLLDLDGVIYEGDTAIDGAADTVAWLQRQGIAHLFLTNTTSRPRYALVDKLAAMGIATDAERILTPPVVARQWLTRHGIETTALFVPDGTRADFHDLTTLPVDAESGAQAVVIGDLGEDWDYATFNRAFRLLMAEPRPRLVALGMTRFGKAEDGLRLDVGPFVAGLSYATGIEPIVTGKPAAAFFEAALERLGCNRADALMIGDDVRGDIGGATDYGIRAQLVRTGKFHPEDAENLPAGAGLIDSIRSLPELLGKKRGTNP